MRRAFVASGRGIGVAQPAKRRARTAVERKLAVFMALVLVAL